MGGVAPARAPAGAAAQRRRHRAGGAALLMLLGLAAPAASADEGATYLPPPPPALAGTWQLSYQLEDGATERRTLTVRQDGSRFVVSDGSTPVADGSLQGHRLQFTDRCADRTACTPYRFVGELHGAYLKGYVTRGGQAHLWGVQQRRLGRFEVRLERTFSLTFDDGPVAAGTDRILATLARFRDAAGAPIRAAFFLVGDAPTGFGARLADYAPFELWRDKGSVLRHPQLTARIAAAGHYIGNHTQHHSWPWWPWHATAPALQQELRGWEAAMAAAGVTPTDKLFRPPYLARHAAAARVAAGLGYRTVGGHTVGDAEPGATLASIERRALQVMEQCAGPAPCTLILHDVREVTVEHLGELVGFLQKQGYRLVSFDPQRDGR